MKRLILCIGILFSLFAVAGDEALYGKAPPPDAVFFRVLNVSGEALSVTLDDKLLIELEHQQISPYGFGSAGKVDLKFNGQSVAVDGGVKSQYTFVYSGADNAPLVLQEQLFDNKRQARMAMYNLSSVPQVTLRSLDGKHKIIENVATNDYSTRDVRAIKLATAIYAGEDKISTSEPLVLMRDKVTSIFVFGDTQTSSLLITQADQ